MDYKNMSKFDFKKYYSILKIDSTHIVWNQKYKRVYSEKQNSIFPLSPGHSVPLSRDFYFPQFLTSFSMYFTKFR
jgi:hypothetical protein